VTITYLAFSHYNKISEINQLKREKVCIGFRDVSSWSLAMLLLRHVERQYPGGECVAKESCSIHGGWEVGAGSNITSRVCSQ
jgi:hypothetical protein